MTWQSLSITPENSAIIQELIERLHDQALLERSIELTQQQIRQPQLVRWSDHSVFSGYAGMVVLDAYLDACFPDQGCDLAGHHYLQCAATNLTGISSGLSGGLSGLAFSATLLSQGRRRYERLLASLDQDITAIVHQQVESMTNQRHGFRSYQYDAISGLAGIGAYLLCRTDDPACRTALHEAGSALVALSGDDDGLPHWYIPHEFIMQDHWQASHPDGLIDSGLAHGIAGPLALLALMYRQGEIIPGHTCALERMADWLLANRCDDYWGVNWGTAYPVGGVGDPPQPSRAAWCYGAPGIARALWLAGDALDHAQYRQVALDAMDAVYRKPVPARGIDAPCLCHGIAGLLQITLRFWNDTRLQIFETSARDLLAQLISLYEPTSLMGYRDQEEYDARVDRSDLLSGSIGVTLALLAASYDVEPTWDRLFLLA